MYKTSFVLNNNSLEIRILFDLLLRFVGHHKILFLINEISKLGTCYKTSYILWDFWLFLLFFSVLIIKTIVDCLIKSPIIILFILFMGLSRPNMTSSCLYNPSCLLIFLLHSDFMCYILHTYS